MTPNSSESHIQREIRLALGQEPGVLMFRNSTGVAIHDTGTIRARTVRYGLAPGSADLIGIVTVDTSNGPIGRFLALEIKRPGERATAQQSQFLQLVRRFNGFAAVVDSVESALAAINRARGGACQ